MSYFIDFAGRKKTRFQASNIRLGEGWLLVKNVVNGSTVQTWMNQGVGMRWNPLVTV